MEHAAAIALGIVVLLVGLAFGAFVSYLIGTLAAAAAGLQLRWPTRLALGVASSIASGALAMAVLDTRPSAVFRAALAVIAGVVLVLVVRGVHKLVAH